MEISLDYHNDYIDVAASEDAKCFVLRFNCLCEYYSYSYELLLMTSNDTKFDVIAFQLCFDYFISKYKVRSCYAIANDYNRIIVAQHKDFNIKTSDLYDEELIVYYPFSVLYRIDDKTDGTFYIGITENKERWSSYKGSGVALKEHLKKYPYRENSNNPNDHIYVKSILQKDFATPDDLRQAEYEEILRYCDKIMSVNIK